VAELDVIRGQAVVRVLQHILRVVQGDQHHCEEHGQEDAVPQAMFANTGPYMMGMATRKTFRYSNREEGVRYMCAAFILSKSASTVRR
jgi:hypothetical protein